MIKEKWQLFVSIGNNDDIAMMKVNYLWCFASIKEKTCIVNLGKKLAYKMSRERNLSLYNLRKNKLICCRKLGCFFCKCSNPLFCRMLLQFVCLSCFV